MIKFTSLSVKTLAIASYYVRFLTQSSKFSQFFLSPLSYAKASKILLCLSIFFCLTLTAKELKGPLHTGWKGKDVCEQLSENRQQRILRCTFPPGVGHEKHKHNANFGYAIAGGKMQLTEEKGSKIVDLATGSYFDSQGKKWHEVLNVGQSTVIYLIIESKGASAKP